MNRIGNKQRKKISFRYMYQDGDAAHGDERYKYSDNAYAPLVFFYTSIQ